MPTLDALDLPLKGPSAWRGEDLVDSDEWIHELTPAEIDELEDALGASRRGMPLAEVDRDDFRLSRLATTIAGWSQELEAGRGFVLVRGLPVERYTEAEASLIYWGIGRHLGDAIPQNTDGDLLGHVRDTGADPTDPSVRRYRTRVEQPYHTDGADIVGLLCLATARAGGASSIVSSITVFNEVLARRPDLAPLFFEPFYFDLYEQQGPGQAPYIAIPLANYFAGRLHTMYIRFYIDQAQRHADVPRLTREQLEVLDLIDEIAGDARFHLDMDFQPGDIQWLSNATILHGRTAYEDDPRAPRHLLRLWLNRRADG